MFNGGVKPRFCYSYECRFYMHGGQACFKLRSVFKNRWTDSGLLIVSRHPITRSEYHRFGRQATFEAHCVDRGALFAELDLGPASVNRFSYFAPHPVAFLPIMDGAPMWRGAPLMGRYKCVPQPAEGINGKSYGQSNEYKQVFNTCIFNQLIGHP